MMMLTVIISDEYKIIKCANLFLLQQLVRHLSDVRPTTETMLWTAEGLEQVPQPKSGLDFRLRVVDKDLFCVFLNVCLLAY